jgi:hypothetical protein
MKINEYSPAQFDCLESDWKKLEKGKDMTPFQSFDWFRNVNRLFFSEPKWRVDQKWVYLVVEHLNEAVIIAPLIIQRFGFSLAGHLWARPGVYMIGRRGFSDYLNLIYDNFKPEVVEFLFTYLRNRYGIKFLSFENLLAEADLATYLTQSHKYEAKNMTCVALTLPPTLSEYQALLSKNTRQNLRTALNRCKRNEIEFTHELHFEVNEKLMLEMKTLREQRLDVKLEKKKATQNLSAKIKSLLIKGLIMFNRFMHGAQDPLSENTRPWCLIVRNKDKLVAFFWGIRSFSEEQLYVIFAAVHPEYEWYSPGKLSLQTFIEKIYKDVLKIKLIDFTRGGESYKYEVGGVARAAYSYLNIHLI